MKIRNKVKHQIAEHLEKLWLFIFESQLFTFIAVVNMSSLETDALIKEQSEGTRT